MKPHFPSLLVPGYLSGLRAATTMPTWIHRVSALALSRRFHFVTQQRMTVHTPPSQKPYRVLLALACLYPMLVLVGCWVLFEAVQQFLTNYFAQIDSVTFHGPR